MPLVGNIRDFGLSDFLYLVDRGYKTGALHLNHEHETAVLYFDKGKLIYGSRTQGERVGELLMRLGKITSQQVEQATQAWKPNGEETTLAQVLVREAILSQEDLQRTLQAHVEEQVYTLFAWAEGEFRFEHGQKPETDAPIMPMPVPVEHLIMEGVRRIDEWGRIKDRIPSTDMIPRFVDQPGERAKGVKLSPEEWRIFARINGKDSLATIARTTSLSEFDVCRVVYGFLTAGLVEVVRKPKAQTPRDGGPSRLKRSLVSRIINRVRSM
ncbi:MAG: DUF4388 domain-containing protein [Chloroflexaceae bacterium]|nr:DUF4388 domain-containing protein [Chloroflexaceae bacterium]